MNMMLMLMVIFTQDFYEKFRHIRVDDAW